MTTDDTAAIRSLIIQSGEPHRDALAALDAGEPVWTTETLPRDFEVTGFLAPFVVVTRRSDGAVGSLEFTHNPRLYFEWREAAE